MDGDKVHIVVFKWCVERRYGSWLSDGSGGGGGAVMQGSGETPGLPGRKFYD